MAEQVELPVRTRRPKGQADKHQLALEKIVATVKSANRYDIKSLREALDIIGDHLTEVGLL